MQMWKAKTSQIGKPYWTQHHSHTDFETHTWTLRLVLAAKNNTGWYGNTQRCNNTGFVRYQMVPVRSGIIRTAIWIAGNTWRLYENPSSLPYNTFSCVDVLSSSFLMATFLSFSCLFRSWYNNRLLCTYKRKDCNTRPTSILRVESLEVPSSFCNHITLPYKESNLSDLIRVS